VKELCEQYIATDEDEKQDHDLDIVSLKGKYSNLDLILDPI